MSHNWCDAPTDGQTDKLRFRLLFSHVFRLFFIRLHLSALSSRPIVFHPPHASVWGY
jgi:hypothetical protein